MDLVLDCAKVKFSNKRLNLLQNALHPMFGLLWFSESKIFVSNLSKDKTFCVERFSTTLNKQVITCQWLNLMDLVVVLEDGEVSLWTFSQNSDHFTHHCSLKVHHKIEELLQIPNQNKFVLLGRDRSTIVGFRDAEQNSKTFITCSLKFPCKSCCWSPHHQCLVILSDGDDNDHHLLFCEITATEDTVDVKLLKRIKFESAIGRLRKMLAMGKYIVCTFDVPLEDNLKIGTIQSSSEDVDLPANNKNGNNVHKMFNYVSELISASSSSLSSSSSLRVFELEGLRDPPPSSSSSPSSSPRLLEVGRISLGDVLVPDLIATHELSSRAFLMVVGSSKCSSLMTFVFDPSESVVKSTDVIEFQDQKVRGIFLTCEGHLWCMTSESPAADPFSFLNFNRNEIGRMKVHRLTCFADTILRYLNGVQHHNHLKPKVEINCNGNDDDDDDDNDGIRLDDSNIIIPGILAGIGKRLIEEFSGDDRKKSSPKSRETQMKITQACVHCGKMNPTPRRSSLDGGNVTSQEGCHGNLEKLVASAMEKEFKKFRLELLDELKALLEK